MGDRRFRRTLVVGVPRDPPLIEGEQKIGADQRREFPDLSRELLQRLVSQGAIRMVKELEMADAQFLGGGIEFGPSHRSQPYCGPQVGSLAVGEDQHGSRRALIDEGIEGRAESEALVIRVGADSKDRGRTRERAKS